jgi:Domain of unknown function (DUF4082)/PASTA domain
MKKRTSETARGSGGNSIPRVVRRVGVAHSVAILLLVIGFASPFSGQTPAVATVGLTPGWATFGEAVPQGVATTGLQIGNLPTQTDIKNRWPDGSIRFAIVTANIPAAGQYAVTSAAPAAGSFTPTMPSAATTLILDGVTYTATLPVTPADDRWLSGPLVSESRSVVAPITAGGTAHDFLRVNFDTRVYSDGQARVDVSVENLLDKVGAMTVAYDATIVVNHQVMFAKRAVQHFYLTRWRKVFEIGSAPLAAVTPDLGPFNAARALPPYLSLVTNVVNTMTGAAYDILREGALTANMSDSRSRPELAPVPDWTARYLVHKNATQRAFVLANGDLSGSWPVHVREAEDGATRGVGAERLLSLDQRPTVWYDARAEAGGVDHLKGTPLPLGDAAATPRGAGQTALKPDNAHQPSLAYVPYLLTGDRYYAEEMAFWANYGLLRTTGQDGIRGANGILAANGAGGYAWALRNLADAAAYYPDASPVRAYLTTKVTANLQWLDAYAHAVQSTPNAPLLWPVQQSDGTLVTRPTEQGALAYAIDRASKQGFAGGLMHRDAIAKAQVASAAGEGAPAVMAAAPGGITTAPAGSRPSASVSSSPETRLVLMIGIENGWSGAQAAYDALWPSVGARSSSGLADLAQRAGWALDFTAPRGPVSRVTVTATESAASDPTTDSVAMGTAAGAATPRTGLGAAPVSMTAAASLPITVVFHASTDHATVVSYLLEVFANGSDPNTATPLASSDLGKPAPDGSGDITVDRTTFFNALAPGTYLVTVSSIGPGGPGRSTAVTFTVVAVPTATLSASPTSISSGQSATLSWSTTDATTVIIDQGIGTVAVSGTRSVSPAVTTIYTLTATNAAGSATATATVTVTADTTPPVLSGVGSSGLTMSGATIGFTTNEQTYHQVEYGTTASYGTMTTPDAMLMTIHSQPLTGLAASTLYHYRGRASDAAGNGGMSGDFTFTTSSAPLPTATLTASPTSITSGAASTLTWSTTGATTVAIDQGIGTVAASGTRSVSPTATTTYTLTATNAAGSVTATASVTVSAPDTTPPVLSGVASSGLTTTSATISFTTNELSYHQVEYGPTVTYGTLTILDTTLRTSHNQVLMGLTPGVVYHYRARATDAAGNGGMSGDFMFTTPATPPPSSLAVGTVVFADGVGNVSAGPFNTAAGDLVVAFATSASPSAGGQNLTISGGSLTWTRVTRANGTPGVADIWQAPSPTAHSTISVTSTQSLAGYTQSLTVVTFSGAAGVGASAGVSGPNGGPSVSLTTTQPGSLLYAAGNDWDSAIARTLGANQAMVHQWLSTSSTYWAQSYVNPVANAGTVVQLYDTAPTTDRWNFAAVEIVAAGKTTPVITWATPASIVSGTALGATQLNATTTVPGTFVYSPASGTVLSAGASQPLSVTFTPTDTASYNAASKTVFITVQALVPNVVSQTQAAATTAINNASLLVGTVTNASSATVASGSVISSNPVAGTQVAAGSAVSLVVSTGPASATVPNVVGQTQAAATTAINNASLVVGTVTNASSATVASGSVISSNPAAGTQVAAGSAVNLVVSTGQPPPPPPPSTVSIWSASAAPSTFATTENSPIELGLKFRSDVAGTVTGVRFYKGTTTTGTHTGTLWSLSGTKLASAVFTGESASGWQTVTFSSPVAITANTVYVVSYHSKKGQYAYTYDTFATAGVDNGPLHALMDGVSGGNGVFRYGGIVLPTASSRSSNYWVDVLFVASTAP